MSHHALVLGGHGKVAQIFTQLLLKDSWTVTSVIRTQDQVPQIERLADAEKNNLNVLIHSLEDVKDVSQAKNILSQVKPDVVVWSGGAGGKGVLSEPAHWWNDASWKYAQEMQSSYLKNYCQAKLAADEIFLQEASKRGDFAGITLQSGMLSDEPAGRIELEKTSGSEGNVSLTSVAETIMSLLDHKEVQTCWLDMLDGDQDVEAAVAGVVRNRDNAAEGEDVYLV
ncbi:hypothetical protein ACHAPT_011020 [Fusarium lateritium]